MPRKKKEEKEKGKYFQAVGRRKRSVARIRLFLGKDKSLVNGKPLVDYFGSAGVMVAESPFLLTETAGKYFVMARLAGGGRKGQLGAYIHGVTRALSQADAKFRQILKENGLLTRDPREKERRKPGYAQKARKRKQSPKR